MSMMKLKKKVNNLLIEYMEHNYRETLQPIFFQDIDIAMLNVETRKKLSKLVSTSHYYENYEYKEDTNVYDGFIFNGTTFNKFFGKLKFKKIIDNSLQMNDYQYELGKINSIKEEISYGRCEGPGLYFSQETDIHRYLTYGQIMVDVKVPEDENVIVCMEDYKIKASSIYISNDYDICVIEKYEDFEKIKDFNKILKVSLVKQELKNIPDEVFICKNLIALDLSNNNIKKVSDKINNLKKLQKINLSYNKIISIFDNECIFPELKELHLQNNRITEIPKNILCFTELRKLNLGNNMITKLIDKMENLTNLIELNLESNKIKYLSKELNNLKIQLLNINDNEIKSINNFTFNTLNSLIELNMEGNKLNKLENIYGLEKLEILNVSNNEITVIPDDICKLSNLIELNISSNQITNISDKLTNLKKIKSLDISSNSFDKIPDFIIDLKILNDLDLFFIKYIKT